MKKSNLNKWLWFITISSTLLLFVNLLLTKVSTDNLKEARNLAIQKLENKEVEKTILFENIKLNSKYEGLVINDFPVFTENGVEIKFSKIIKDRNILILRYSELNCSPCVDSSISLLNNWVMKIGQENIVILSSYENQNHLNIFKRINNIYFPVYNIKEKIDGMQIEELNKPYIFSIDKKKEIHGLFIPEKTMPEMNIVYLNSIYTKYFTQL